MKLIQYSEINEGLVADWTDQFDDSVLLITPNRTSAERLLVNLQSLHGKRIRMLPGWDIRPDDMGEPDPGLQKKRITSLIRFRKDSIKGLLLPVRSLGTRILSPDHLPYLSLEPGNNIPPQQVMNRLVSLGFTRRPLVEEPGSFSRRGDLLDIFPENLPHPLRISFFGDEIEEIHFFHPNTQYQVDEQPDTPVHLSLQSEFSLGPEEVSDLQRSLVEANQHELSQQLEYENHPEGLTQCFDDRWPRPLTWPDRLFDSSRTAFYQPRKIADEVEAWDQAVDPSGPGPFRQLTPIIQDLPMNQSVAFSYHPHQTDLFPEMETKKFGTTLDVAPGSSLDSRPISEFLDVIDDTARDVDELLIHCGEDGFRQRLREHMQERFGTVSTRRGARVKLLDSPWKGSYRLRNRARISLDDFFNRTISRGRSTANIGRTEYLESFEQLNPGDLVVHEQYGIGRFRGLKRITTETQTRDVIMIEYAHDDRVYLPPDQIAYVQKYMADSGFSPGLTSLNSGRWEKTREGVEEDIEKLAEELLELYSSREQAETRGFPADNLEQKQFEATFPYRETPDQQDAIEAVKADMQANEPMNRLICGDSGFGKTEVALRAAFKAASSGRQVAMLVPTTVLAQQHFNTFEERFALFPYDVKILTRFQGGSEEQSIQDGLRSGEVDIVIGTHRLLSEDIEFRDLGLLIIDEEQRFGVEQKETLKFYREHIDVLTLSATPIPRTLYMSLSGVQDISQINTPPEERNPVEITVSGFQKSKAQRAVETELERNGQVFWISNRVQTIREETEFVRTLVPGAEVCYAHGQMNKQELRNTMDRFYGGEIDVLVCTTIVEAGLDCPRANTMIIRNAQRFGLAQLYQLRGRVGRSHEQAHAYLFFPEQNRLTEDAEARLKTIKRCSELGAGFRVAMRDMEIRGAGHILGKNQHGNIRSVGFPLYCKLLQRSIRKLREGFEVPRPFPKLDFPGEHYIPNSYIPLKKQIIRQYQALAECRSMEDVDQLKQQWRETFGPLPQPTQNELLRHRFKIMANEQGWRDLRFRDNRLNFQFVGELDPILEDAAKRIGAIPEPRGNRLKIRGLDEEKLYKWLKIVTHGKAPSATAQSFQG